MDYTDRFLLTIMAVLGTFILLIIVIPSLLYSGKGGCGCANAHKFPNTDLSDDEVEQVKELLAEQNQPKELSKKEKKNLLLDLQIEQLQHEAKNRKTCLKL